MRDLGGAGRVHEEPRLHEGRWAAAVAHGDAPARSPKPALVDRPPAAPLSAACAFFCAECRRSCRACVSAPASPGTRRPAVAERQHAEPSCTDATSRCAGWAKEEHCVRNRRFMCAVPLAAR